MYQCTFIPSAINSALRTEHLCSIWIWISLKMPEYSVKNTSQGTYSHMEHTYTVGNLCVEYRLKLAGYAANSRPVLSS